MLVTKNLSTFILTIKFNINDKLISKITKKEYIFYENSQERKYEIELLK
jgi:hypothetical protein